MARYSAEFGVLIKKQLDSRSIGPYEVERLSEGRISHQTVRNMLNGKVPYVDYIETFASVLDLPAADVNEILSAIGSALRVPVSPKTKHYHREKYRTVSM